MKMLSEDCSLVTLVHCTWSVFFVIIFVIMDHILFMIPTVIGIYHMQRKSHYLLCIRILYIHLYNILLSSESSWTLSIWHINLRVFSEYI
jgi:hypothetical protein